MPGGVDALVHERDEQAMRARLTPALSTYERYAKSAKDRIGGNLGSADPMRRDLIRKDLDKAGFTGISVEEYITFYNVAGILGFLAGIVFVGIGVFLGHPHDRPDGTTCGNSASTSRRTCSSIAGSTC